MSTSAASAVDVVSKLSRLFDAALQGNTTAFEEAVKSVDSQDLKNVKDASGRSVLHYAALSGNSELCQQLIDQYGLDVNATDVKSGRIPMRLLTARSHFAIPPTHHLSAYKGVQTSPVCITDLTRP